LGSVLRGATVIELAPPLVEQVALRVENGLIVARGEAAVPQEGDEVIDLAGRIVMPGLVCAHHHLYAILGRGMPKPPEVNGEPTQFADIISQGMWRLDSALDLDAVQWAATASGIEALGMGTTTVVDHHASPKCIQGSLLHVARGLNELGLRGVLSYEVSDRYGALAREEALDENLMFLRKARGRFRGMIGAHASYTLSKDALDGLAAVVKETGAGVHMHLAEDVLDEKVSFERFGEVPVARLAAAGVLNAKAILAHAVQLSWPELSQVLTTGAWLVHNPRSNMNHQVGYAPAGKFGSRATLGADGLGADMFAEAQVAHLRARDAGQPIDVMHYLSNGHRLATQVFGLPVGPMREGAVADLLVLDYRSPTPLTVETLRWHLLHGMGSHCVESVMIDGVWRRWARRTLNVDLDALYAHGTQVVKALWARLDPPAPVPVPSVVAPAPVETPTTVEQPLPEPAPIPAAEAPTAVLLPTDLAAASAEAAVAFPDLNELPAPGEAAPLVEPISLPEPVLATPEPRLATPPAPKPPRPEAVAANSVVLPPEPPPKAASVAVARPADRPSAPPVLRPSDKPLDKKAADKPPGKPSGS
jgi:putative selenium metabolism protein SsnA